MRRRTTACAALQRACRRCIIADEDFDGKLRHREGDGIPGLLRQRNGVMEQHAIGGGKHAAIVLRDGQFIGAGKGALQHGGKRLFVNGMVEQVDLGAAVVHLAALGSQYKGKSGEHLGFGEGDAEHFTGAFHDGAALYGIVGKFRCKAAIGGQRLFDLGGGERRSPCPAAADQQQAAQQIENVFFLSHITIAPLPNGYAGGGQDMFVTFA